MALSKWISCLTGALALAAACPDAAQDAEKVLNIYNWSDYIGEDTIRNFEKETGIQVHYDSFDSNEMLHSKLIAGKTGYDVVVPSSHWAGLQIRGGLYQPLAKDQIPNLRNVDPAVAAQLARIDPGNRYLVDWLWGYTTVGINVDRVRKALGDLPMPQNAWDLVFKPAYAVRLKSCGVSFLDSSDEIIPAALHYLGKSTISADPADYEQVRALLQAVRPAVSQFSSSSYINDLAEGSLCAVIGWNGDINIARQRALANHSGQVIESLIPKTGGLLYFDAMAVPADAPHPRNAMLWINYVLRPEVAAGISAKVLYANAVPESRRFLDPPLANNATLFLSAQTLGAMVPPESHWTHEVRRLQTHTYMAFKTGF